ncbi:hypothetical protein QE152_g10421 [Popillia japonica]|uniref:Uncharacterized protein n=1 Tax=Popillia japonica TaxID=7064 RepID=A0AAW1LVH4_POPJA
MAKKYLTDQELYNLLMNSNSDEDILGIRGSSDESDKSDTEQNENEPDDPQSEGVNDRHIKRVHQVAVEGARRSLMLCPLCADGSEVKTYEGLRKHIKENHKVNIAQLTYQFSSNQD